MRIRWRNLELPSRVDREEASITYGRFSVEPFERGFGTTVGNSLRRILLSSLEGTAVTHVRISGVEHEYQSVQGVYQDVADIILNVKQLLIDLEGDEPATLHVQKKGKGVVTAGDIQTDHRTEVLNPELELCEIVDAKTSFEMYLTVATGRGFVTADENAPDGREVGTIPVDSLFSPVQRVRFKTENTRVGKMTNYDKLILEIWTNGVVTPEMALVEGAKILRKHLNPFVQYFEPGREIGRDSRGESPSLTTSPAPAASASAASAASNGAAAASGGAKDGSLAAKLDLPIGELELSQRAGNCLASENIKTVGDLVRRTEADLLKVRNFGKTTLKEIEEKLTPLDLTLGMDVDGIKASAR